MTYLNVLCGINFIWFIRLFTKMSDNIHFLPRAKLESVLSMTTKRTGLVILSRHTQGACVEPWSKKIQERNNVAATGGLRGKDSEK
jgi:hypothetical protein